MSTVIDLSGLMNVQNTYLNDLKTMATTGKLDAAGVTGANTAITNIQSSNAGMYTSFQAASGSASQMIDHQKDMQSIVNNELTRLQDKKGQIDTALIGQKRIISLNESYRQRYSQYINVIIIIIITLALIVVLNIMSKTFLTVPSYIFDILSAIVLAAGIYIGYLLILNINSRSNMDFNKVATQPPKLDTPSDIANSQNAAFKSGNLLGTINIGCVGPDCCSDGTIWDNGNSVCIPGNPFLNMDSSPFKTISISYNNGPIKPISPTEFDNYYPYK